jgi:hypothetical protein
MTLLLEAEPMLNRTPPDAGVKDLRARFQAVHDRNGRSCVSVPGI